MKTYNDLTLIGESEEQRILFVESAITDFLSSEKYAEAKNGDAYASGKNVTIMEYQKFIRDVKGRLKLDIYTANHKCASGYFKMFTTQITSYVLKNGVTFKNEKTKEKLGKFFDRDFYKAVKKALEEGYGFGYYNLDHVEFFKATEFVPLFDEEDGALKAGIRFWQIDATRPLRATLYEIDGYTDYIKTSKDKMKVLTEKRSYQQLKVKSPVDDSETVYNMQNYPSFPIVPLYVNGTRESELVGIREQIDAYDLIKSGFANDLDDVSTIYWTLENAGGMQDVDLAKFVERMKTLKAAVVDGDEGARAEAHTIDVPYQSREAYLTRLEKDLYRDAMALDTRQIAGGAITATQIMASYEPLDQKAFELQTCLTEFIQNILALAGIDDTPTFTPARIVNRREETEIVLLAAEYLDDDTILEKLPFLTANEVERIKEKKIHEDAGRFQTEE